MEFDLRRPHCGAWRERCVGGELVTTARRAMCQLDNARDAYLTSKSAVYLYLSILIEISMSGLGASKCRHLCSESRPKVRTHVA